jgi:hypothetical protein
MKKGFLGKHFGAFLKGNNRIIKAEYARSLTVKPGIVDYNLMGIKNGSR